MWKWGSIAQCPAWNGSSNFRLLLSRVSEGESPYGRTSTKARSANTVFVWYFWLPVSNVVYPGRGAGRLFHEISSRGVSGLWSYAGQKRHVFFLLSLHLLPLSCLLLLPLNVQLLRDQISGLGTSQPLKHSHAEGWIAAVDRGHFNSLGWVNAQFTHSVYHILISS